MCLQLSNIFFSFIYHIRYMYEYGKPTPGVVYFDPRMTEVICYAAWKFGSEYKILIRQIQLCITDELIESKKGVFFKLEDAFQRKMRSRFYTLRSACHEILLIISQCNSTKLGNVIFTVASKFRHHKVLYKGSLRHFAVQRFLCIWHQYSRS